MDDYRIKALEVRIDAIEASLKRLFTVLKPGDDQAFIEALEGTEPTPAIIALMRKTHDV